MGDFGFGGPTNDDPEGPDPGGEANTGDTNVTPGGPDDSANPLNPNSQVTLISQNSTVAAPDDSGAYDGGSSPYGTYLADNSGGGSARPQSYNDRDLDLDDPSSSGASVAEGQAYGAAVANVIVAFTDLVTEVASDALSDLLGLSPPDDDDTPGASATATPGNVVAVAQNPPSASSDSATSPASPSTPAPAPFGPSIGAIAPSLTNPSISPEGSGTASLIAQPNGAPGLTPGAISGALNGSNSGTGLNPWAGSNPSSSALPGLQNAATMGFRGNLPTGFNGATATASTPRSVFTSTSPNNAESVVFDVVRGALRPLIAINGANVTGLDAAFIGFWRDAEGILQAQRYVLGVKSSVTGRFPADELEPHFEQQTLATLSATQFEDPEEADAVARSLADPNAKTKFLRATVNYSVAGQGRVEINGFAIAEPEYVPGELVFEGPSPFFTPPTAAADADWSWILDSLEPGEWPGYFDLPASTPGFNAQDGIPLGDGESFLMPRGFQPPSNNLSSGTGTGGYPGASTVTELTGILSGSLIVLGVAGIALDVWQAPAEERFSRGAIDVITFGATLAFAGIFPEITIALLFSSMFLQSRPDASGPHTDA